MRDKISVPAEGLFLQTLHPAKTGKKKSKDLTERRRRRRAGARERERERQPHRGLHQPPVALQLLHRDAPPAAEAGVALALEPVLTQPLKLHLNTHTHTRAEERTEEEHCGQTGLQW